MNHTFNDPRIRFGGSFRDYQQAVLDEADHYLKDGRIHVVAAPGSGKTILGLELIRRLGQPALILSPSVTIRQQWGDRFRQNFLTGVPENEQQRFAERTTSYSLSKMQDKLITSVTYQSLHAAMKRAVSEEEVSEWDEAAGKEDFSDFDLLAEVRRAGIGTICLDEAHHLRSAWQKALEDFLKALGGAVTVISLTATPPYDSSPAEWEKYSTLCGEIDAEIFVPQLVAQKTLCPHQDYIYFNYPSREETAVLNAHRDKASEVVGRLLEQDIFSKALTAAGILPDFTVHEELILENPRAFSSIFTCIVFGEGKTLPRKLLRLISPKGTLPFYRMARVEEALSFLLDNPDLFTEELIEPIRKTLSDEGMTERQRLCLGTTDKIRRMLLSSIGKLDSIVKITEAEWEQLGGCLRMLILTDHIKRELLSAVGTDDPLRSMGTVPIFETLRRRFGTEIPMAVLSGSLIIIPHTAYDKIAALAEAAAIPCRAKPLVDTGYDELILGGSNKHKVAIMTDAFAAGCFSVLIGTKSLLGEGWDSPCINALILASFVGSFMLSNQMRGRAIRTDKNQPAKTANIWHLVTVEPPPSLREIQRQMAGQFPQIKTTFDSEGTYILGDDYATMVRRFDAFLAPAYHADIIESGIERLDVIKPPYDKVGIDRINREMLTLSADRDYMARRWSATLGDNTRPEVRRANEIPKPAAMTHVFFNNVLSALITSSAMTAMLVNSIRILTDTGELYGLILSIPLLALYLYAAYKWLPKIAAHLSPAKSVKTLANAVLYTLRDMGQIESRGARVQILHTDRQGSIVCTLRNATEHEKNVFATALSEMLSPIENPRYIIVKRVSLLSHGWLSYGDSFACPAIIAGKKENVEFLAHYLRTSTGNFTPIYTRNEEGRAHLLRARKKSYINRNSSAVTGKRTVQSRWD